MLSFAKNNQYPPKYLYFGCKRKKYSSYCKLHSCIGGFTNLNKHLTKHESTLNWYNCYIKYVHKKNDKNTDYISDEKLNLIKFFITSNLSLAQLRNVYLRSILKDEVKLPSFFTFRYKYLNEVMSLLHGKIEKKCQDASYITLIPDGWTDSSGTEYLGK